MPSSPFDARFQMHFLAHLVRDGEFLKRVYADVTPDVFDNEYGQRVVRLARAHFEEFSAPLNDLAFSILDKQRDQGHLSKDLHANLSEFVDKLFECKLSNRDYLLAEFDTFTKNQLFVRNVPLASEAIRVGEFEKAESLLSQVFRHKSVSKVDLGGIFSFDPDDRIRRRLQDDGKRFWWLLPDIDKRVKGLKRGELGVLQSQRSSGGKSAMMTYLTRQFAFQGAKILIITLEMDVESYEDRLDQCICGLVDGELTDRQKLVSKLRKLIRFGDCIWIKQFPGGTSTVDDLKEFKTLLVNSTGFIPDVLILDYADELTVKGATPDSSFETGKQIYSSLRGWAIEDQLAIWTGMQSNRGALEAGVADQEHTGGSLAKAQIADLIVSLNSTKEEAEQGLLRLHWVKNRRGQARFDTVIKADFARMNFGAPA